MGGKRKKVQCTVLDFKVSQGRSPGWKPPTGFILFAYLPPPTPGESPGRGRRLSECLSNINNNPSKQIHGSLRALWMLLRQVSAPM